MIKSMITCLSNNSWITLDALIVFEMIQLKIVTLGRKSFVMNVVIDLKASWMDASTQKKRESLISASLTFL